MRIFLPHPAREPSSGAENKTPRVCLHARTRPSSPGIKNHSFFLEFEKSQQQQNNWWDPNGNGLANCIETGTCCNDWPIIQVLKCHLGEGDPILPNRPGDPCYDLPIPDEAPVINTLFLKVKSLPLLCNIKMFCFDKFRS